MIRRLLPLALCGACTSILGIPEPSLSESPGTPDARVLPPDAPPGPDAPPPIDASPPDAHIFVTLTVTKDPSGTGQGTVTSDLGGLSCDKDCAGGEIMVDPGTGVNLEAKPAPGSFFTGWSGACSGLRRFCSVAVNDAASVTATFSLNDHNLMFVTTQAVTGNFGGLAGGDTICANAASKAGLSGTFVALLSVIGKNGKDRLVLPGTSTPSRGFVRMDGKPVADLVTDLTTSFKVYYPPILDENGDVDLSFVWTGTQQDGTIATSTNCQDFTVLTGMGQFGDPGSGSNIFGTFNVGCDSTARLLCVQTDKTSPITAPTPVQGKKMYVTKANFNPGGGGVLAANNLCDAEKPAGVQTVKALLPTTQAPASSVLKADTLYVRPDGVPIGRGADIGPTHMITAPTVHGDGSYAPFVCCVLRGPGDISSIPPTDGICNNWTSSSTSLKVVHTALSVVGFWEPQATPLFDCSGSLLLTCVEQ